MKRFRTSLIMIAVLLLTYTYLLVSSPLPYSVIDQDSSGIVSPAEAVASTEIETRSLIKAGELCIEYFWLKNGKTAHSVCNEIDPTASE